MSAASTLTSAASFSFASVATASFVSAFSSRVSKFEFWKLSTPMIRPSTVNPISQNLFRPRKPAADVITDLIICDSPCYVDDAENHSALVHMPYDPLGDRAPRLPDQAISIRQPCSDHPAEDQQPPQLPGRGANFFALFNHPFRNFFWEGSFATISR